jgi:hypothetical protein
MRSHFEILNQNTLFPPQLDELDHFRTAVTQAETSVGGPNVIQGGLMGLADAVRGNPMSPPTVAAAPILRKSRLVMMVFMASLSQSAR